VDAIDAEIAVGLVNDYWPRTLGDDQLRAWGRGIVNTEMGTTRQRPPTLAELCGALRRPGAPTPVELVDPVDVPVDTGPPADPDRGMLWARHVARVGRIASQLRDRHDHGNGWQTCPVCAVRRPWRTCGDPSCFCAD
jgi:hypothetical protein